MGLLFVFAVVIWCIAGEGSAQNRRPSSNDGYVLVFSDEFNQRNGSQPDPTKWRVPQRDSNVRWKRWVSNSPKVAFIKNGSLVCRAIPNRSASNDTARILTGAVDTRHTFTMEKLTSLSLLAIGELLIRRFIPIRHGYLRKKALSMNFLFR